ncbi:sigma-54 interaction domain-containing protein [Pendulispora albinea]|uniref:Sigma-54 dependent transcriptional regulator n=1 Tax=Pendulispora albinea TaxID=2741071 RepID=A0ABZ2M3T7_9BACT
MPRSKRQLDVVLQPVLRSAAMRNLDRIIRKVADKDVIVTFIGESGTGKEVLARRIHDRSARCRGPFIPINCAAIPEALFESELFGHEKGAFTGANDRARGKVEAAAGGTLFLDELGEMPIGVQAKLLRFLENRKFMRVGGTTKIAVDVRLVTATLRPLEAEVKTGRFRADLFYRIQGISLNVPPLRDRQADLPILVRQFVETLSVQHGTKPPRFTRAAMAALRNYPWPGNVRELRNLVELVCLLRDGKQIRTRDLPPPIREAAPQTAPTRGEPRIAPGAEILEIRLDEPLEGTIDRILRAALDLEGGNRSRAARRLGISVRTMQRYASRAVPDTRRVDPSASTITP